MVHEFLRKLYFATNIVLFNYTIYIFDSFRGSLWIFVKYKILFSTRYMFNFVEGVKCWREEAFNPRSYDDEALTNSKTDIGIT